jgi:hypothetical protein
MNGSERYKTDADFRRALEAWRSNFEPNKRERLVTST